MSFEVDVRLRRGEREIACAFASDARATVLVGPSGAGKTSVLHAVAGLLQPVAGRIVVDGVALFGAGVNVPVERRRAGVVFQDTRLFPHLSVRRNLAFGIRAATSPSHLPRGGGGPGAMSNEGQSTSRGVSKLDPRLRGGGEERANSGRGERGEGAGSDQPFGAQERLNDIAALLDLTALLDRKPATLSGGEARRVAIGRALLMRPAFLLLDEPTVSLDAVRREEVLRAVERARDAAGVPVLMVTHDEAEAARIGTVVTMGVDR